MSDNLESDVARHYAREGLLDRILAALTSAGVDINAMTIDDLAPADEFHTAGKATTEKALAMTPLARGMHVLDAGGGIGGAARPIASRYGCRTTSIDLTPEYTAVARALTERIGLSSLCAFETASVLDMPFPDRTFDAAVTMHVAMNIENRPRFYGELARVLKSGAPLCVFDVMKGPAPGMDYPVPWAETEATSILKSPDETRALLEAAGFHVAAQESLKEYAIDFFRMMNEKLAKDGAPAVGLHLLMGESAGVKFANYAAALNAGRIEPVIMIARSA